VTDDVLYTRWALPVRDGWFETQHVDPAITLIWEPYVHEFIRCNIWHVRGSERDLLVDTGLGIARLVESLPSVFRRAPFVVATHAHYDHVGGLHEFSNRAIHPLETRSGEAPLFASLVVPSAQDGDAGTVLLTALPHSDYDPRMYTPPAVEPTESLQEGDLIDLGNRRLAVVHLPGHSPGSVGFWEESTGILFSGDAIYDGQLFDTLPGSNITDYVSTMKRLREMPVSVVHSGHGPSFGPARLIELADGYLRTRQGQR
jgi:glyoxylase-like metal-dependent hydrolase (beta-lactamase superfamily II)